MEKYENIIKIEEIRRLVDDQQYLKAIKILDTIDSNKIKSLTDLSIIAEVFTQNERYDEAMIVLTKIYKKTKTRRILYQLVDLSIKSGSISEAEDYLAQYIKVAPQDTYRLIFRYCIDRLNSEPYEILIESLENLKEYEYIEMWAYELAKVYHKAGMTDKCVRECSDIVLWFGEGLYVEKAKLLKAYYVGDINPINILKYKEKMDTEKKLGLDNTKDYSSIRSQIDSFLAENEKVKAEKDNESILLNTEEDMIKDKSPVNENLETDELINLWDKNVEAEAIEVKTTNGAEDREIFKETNVYQEVGAIEEGEAIEAGESIEEGETIEEGDVVEETAEIEDVDIIEERAETAVLEDVDIIEETADLEDGYETNKLEQTLTEKGINCEKAFGYFNQIDVCRIQIETCLKNILNDNTKSIHVIITGERKSGKTTLAKNLVKMLYCLNWINFTKVATITATKLNSINLEQKSNQLTDSSLIIEEAGSLDDQAVEQLLHLMWSLHGHLTIFLEDSESRIEQLLETHPKLAEVFDSQIDLQPYTNQDLYGFANHFIAESDYQLSEEAKEGLLTYIAEIMDTVDVEDQLKTIMDFTQKAKMKADERNKQLLYNIIGTRNLSSTEFLYIKLEDLY